jgi:hypothetical protein
MSGQPVKTQSDINKFKNEYLESLNLQESINDMNLQANKTYLLTGQLPPQSQLQDTRTNAEKLKDVEMMKQKVASDLRLIAEPSFAYQIVNKIIESPLNVDNSLFRFLAQRAPSITEQLVRILPYGIAGDDNDLFRIVDFIKNMYSEQQGKFQSTKSYLNSIGSTSTSSKVLSGNDIDSVIMGLQEIIKSGMLIIQSGYNAPGILNNSIARLRQLNDNIVKLKNSLPTTTQIQMMIEEIDDPRFNNPYPNIIGPLLANQSQPKDFSRVDMEAFYKFLDKLPKYTEVMALISKIKQFINSQNYKLVGDGILNLEKMFSMLYENDFDGLLDKFKNIKDRQKFKQEKNMNLQSEQTREFIQRQNEEQKDASKAQKVYIVNPESDAVWTRTGAVQMAAAPVAGFAPAVPPVAFVPNAPPAGQEPGQVNRPARPGIPMIGVAGAARDARIIVITREVNNLTEQQLAEVIALRNSPDVFDRPSLMENLIRDITYNRGDLGHVSGLGIKKRVGRPRGSGMPKPVPIKIPNFIGFGINEINQKQLENGIVKIRRNTRTNYPDMPSKRVSNSLKSILKTIVGGGIPKYDELGRLDEEEKEYLHKLVSRSNLGDRLSVPAPSKDNQEKDIHQFEVLKGQIMSGNDSVELVKKFKLLIRKLSRQGLLPKADVDDLMDTLIELNY